MQKLNSSTLSSPPRESVVDAIRSDLVNYEVALRQATQHLHELDVTLDGLEKEEELDVTMWGREEARSNADERAVAARLRRTNDLLRSAEERLADVVRTYPEPEDYARDIREMEAEVAKLSQAETEAMQELTKASTLLSVLQTRRNEARNEELRYLDRLRSEAEQLASRVYRRPSVVLGLQRSLPPPGRTRVGDSLDNGAELPHPPPSRPSPLSSRFPGQWTPFSGAVPDVLPPRRPPLPAPHGDMPTAQRRGPPFIRSQRDAKAPLLGPWLSSQLQSLLAHSGPAEIGRLREMISSDRSLVERVDEHGNTPLHMACNARPPSLAIVDELIMAGASLHATNDDGLTAFHVACLNPADAATNELKRFLVGTVGYNVDERTRDGETAAHLLAVDDSYLAAMRFLIQCGCNLLERACVAGRWCTPADIAYLSGPSRAGRMQKLLDSSLY